MYRQPNKAMALCCLLFANFTLLVHAAIPHHHHDGIPVILSSIHHDESHPDDPDNTEIIYIRLGNDKQTCQSLDFGYDLMPCLLTLFSDYFTYRIQDDTGLLFRHPPYIQLQHTESIARSIGLRAPPFQLKITNYELRVMN
jgi:hypothetical protein